MTLRISRILHAGYVFEREGVEIAFDPVFENPFSVNCHAFPDVSFDRERIRALRFAAVFISHYHEDHCSLESLALLDRSTPIYVFSVFEELRDLIRALGFTDVRAIALDVPVAVGPFEVVPRRALDADVDSIFHVKAGGLNVLHVVDSWIDPETFEVLLETARWDLVLWPFQTMRELEVLSPSRAPAAPSAPPFLPPEWRAQLEALAPRYVVPSSCQFRMEPWSWYNHAFFPLSYRQFAEEIASLLPHARVVRMNPGVSVALDADILTAAPPLPWMTPVGAQDVDYEYDPALEPPPTSEIARRLRPLSAAETTRVLDYCRSGLLERLRALDPPADPYFERPRLWRLRIHHHDGAVTHFDYLVDGGHLSLAGPGDAPLAWVTEIPATKLLGALERGESLTSIYVRINDVTFAPQIEAELAEVDLLEDPLLRALFTGVFGAYQRAQLARIQAAR